MEDNFSDSNTVSMDTIESITSKIVDDSSDDDDEESSYYLYNTNKKLEEVRKNRLDCFVASQIQHTPVKRGPRQDGKRKMDAWDFVMSWSEDLFYQQFRMFKKQFFEIVRRCKEVYPGSSQNGLTNYDLAVKRGNASTCGKHTSIEIKLCIFLRLCAGASHIDMIWYGVALTSVNPIFLFMLDLVDKALPDEEIFNFPKTQIQLEECANEWSQVMIKSKGFDLFEGTLLAGDGLVVPINCPSEKDLHKAGLSAASFRNRKGCFAIIVSAFCDAFGMIRYIQMDWPGSTPDITAYRQTDLYNKFDGGKIPTKYHLVLDEAYSSIGGDQHLTPFSRNQLIKARLHSKVLYGQMKAFNNILSSQRITIERCFGMWVRKWGILWKNLEHDLPTNQKIIKVTAKLHNVCISEWKVRGKRCDEIAKIERDFIQSRNDTDVFYLHSDQFNGGDLPDDHTVQEYMENNLRDGSRAATTSQKKQQIMQRIVNCGFTFHHNQDNDFILN